MQFECWAINERIKEEVVILQLPMVVRELKFLFEAEGGSLPEDILIDFNFKNILESNSSIAAANEDEDRNNNFVNSFYIVVGKAFLELMIDIGHFILLLITIINPWQFQRLMGYLLEPFDYLPLRIC